MSQNGIKNYLLLLLCSKESDIPLNLLSYEASHLYIVRPRSAIEGTLNVIKIGRSSKPIGSRLRSYEKGSQIIWAQFCDSAEKAEQRALAMLRAEFTERKDFGSEYFEGNIVEIIRRVQEIVLEDV